MYKYHFRPAYGSQTLLIEVFSGAEKETFLSDFLAAIEILQPHISAVQDFWMNDEILLNATSGIGAFTISKDSWGLAFIMAEDNQAGLYELESVLNASEKFEKTAVGFNKYNLE